MGSLPLILAQAGSGSSGFGGGGGGGGGSSFGGGGSGSGEGDPLVAVVVFGLFGVFLLYLAFHTVRYRRKLRERDRAVRTASAEAAEDDAYFASDELERRTVALFQAAQMAWDARDRGALARLVGPDLLVEWNRRLDDFDRKGWHNRVEVLEDPTVLYVGSTNREDGAEDRAVVRIEAKLRAYVVDRDGDRVMRAGEKDELVTLTEYWTLARRDGAWMVHSIEQRQEGDHHLEEVVASPWSDEQRWTTSRSPSSLWPMGCPRASPRRIWPRSTSMATRGHTRSTSRSPTLASLPTCWRRRRGERSRRGPRPWTATTLRSSAWHRPALPPRCCTAGTPPARHA
jgi:Tim44-like domain